MPNGPDPLTEGSLLAAIDLGSNSFHLIVARLEHGELKPVETLAEKVQLGAGLERGKLAKDAIERGLTCLSRFAQLLDSIEPSRIRVVGTNALRQAKNRREFTEAAEEILGVPIDVVYGREEARLVYVGVAHTLADDERSRLVVDIGGGSTEFIVGQRFEPMRMESLQIGCVSYAEAFFGKGQINKKSYQAAYDQTLIEVSHIRKHYRSKHWVEAVGSSGTLQAIEMLITMAGWRPEGIDRKSLEKLRKKLLKYEHADALDLEGLNDNRRYVIAAGVAITEAIFDGLGIDVMRTSRGALREGVLYDLIGRLQHEDVRERTINALLARYNADESTATILGNRVAWLSESVAPVWQFSANEVELLQWAGRCHEIGVAIAQKHFNRHSAYLLQNSDLPGFSQQEQELMATVVRGLTGKIRADLFTGLGGSAKSKVKKMIALLRIASIFKYVEELEDLPEFMVSATEDSLNLSFPEGWCEQHPLTLWELEEAHSAFTKLGIKVVLR